MKLPDGPKLPALLQTLYMIADPTGFLTTCARQYGDTFTLRVLGPNSPPVVFFSHPQAIQAIFTTLANQFELGKVTHVFRPLTGEQSLIMQDGAHHQKQRQLLMPALHGEGLSRCGELICQISQQAASASIDSVVSVQDWMLEISLEVILRVVFGLQPGLRYAQLRAKLHQLLKWVNSPLFSVQFFLPPLQQDWGTQSPWGRFVRLRQQIDQLLYAEIAERRQADGSTQQTDILSMLLLARDGEGQSLSDQELRDQLMTLLLLGHETTASGLTWAFYWLHQNPPVQARLLAELAAVPPEVDAIQLAQQPYLNAVCKEALRVYPIALISQPRKVKQTVRLEGYEFEPGAILVPCIYLAHRRAEAYPNPTQFCPDRFLANKLSPYEYFPFGGGNRSCIGMALALFEMKLVLATLLRQVEFRPVQPVSRSMRPARRGITFVPPSPFQLSVTERRVPAKVSIVNR
jgi:cytochrome P450 family 110